MDSTLPGRRSGFKEEKNQIMFIEGGGRHSVDMPAEYRSTY